MTLTQPRPEADQVQQHMQRWLERAVIGLKNHGLTITGLSIAEIFDRISGMIVPQVPMS